MAYFTEEKIKTAASLIVDNVNAGVQNDADSQARTYLSDYANYLDFLVAEKGILVDKAAYQEQAEQVRRIAKLQVQEQPQARPLHVIARDIRKSWRNVNYAALPYLQAMSALDKVTDSYGFDSGRSIVRYFLANATTWKGEEARTIKAELKGLLK